MLGAINQRSDKFILAQSRKGRQEKSLSSSHGLGMYTHFIRIAVVLLLCTVTLGPAVAYSQTKVLVGLTTLNSRVTPLWIAQEQGFFAKNGLEVLLLLTRVSQPAIAGLIAGELQMVFGGSSAALGAFASGADLKVIAGQMNRLTYDLVARPGLRKPEDLRGKRLGAGAIGGSLWMGAVLALEHLGLDASRDQISIMLVGDQTNNIQALEAGSIDAALLDGVFSHRLKQKGFPVLAELYNANIPFSGQGIVTSRSFLQKHPVIVERFLKGLLEGIDFSLALGNKPVVLKTMTARLKIPDAASAEVGYQDLLRGVEPKPYPSLEALRNVQRLMKAQNPKVGNVKLEELIDDRILRKILGG
jgi:ABC-type nitrate/sulfonate/bicarbonate transport system substrate-binding protein